MQDIIIGIALNCPVDPTSPHITFTGGVAQGRFHKTQPEALMRKLVVCGSLVPHHGVGVQSCFSTRWHAGLSRIC